MSHQNVEVVRKAFEAWNADDMDALAALFVGRDAVMRWFEQLRETLDSDQLAPSGIIDVGDRVLVTAAWRGIGRGPELAMELTLLYTLRKG
ncbi:MAG TPA: nuclear transport factor 2 family protein [Thermoleophilaceae bacterium]